VDLSAWIVVLMCAAALVAWAMNIGKVWNERRADSRFAEPPDTWLYGRALWRGTYRLIPLLGPIFLLGLVLFVLERSDANGPFADALYTALGPLALVMFVLLFSIVLFNSPKRLVAPHLRSEPGVLKEWFSRGRRAG
jgi:hypothetical protein